MKILNREQLDRPVYVMPGDTVEVTQSNPLTGEVVLTQHRIEKCDRFDVAFIAEIEPGDLGLEAGYVGGIGRRPKGHV